MLKIMIVLGLFLLAGCNCVYDIQVNKDGSACVEHKTQLIYKDDILLMDSTLIVEAERVGDAPEHQVKVSKNMVEPYLNSSIIHDFEWDEKSKFYFDASYTIDNIDSLGSYMDVFFNYVHPTFSFEDEKFTMTCPVGADSAVRNDVTFGAIFIDITLQFKSKIYGCTSNEEKISRAHSRKKLHLKFQLKDLFYKEEITEIVVYFEPQTLGCFHG